MGWTIFFYQRLQPDGPRFAPNFAQEGGVMAKFVHDFYPNLPNITILMQAEPHTRLFLRCLPPSSSSLIPFLPSLPPSLPPSQNLQLGGSKKKTRC